MKCTLQLVVVFLNAQTHFRDNVLKFTHEMASQPPFSLSNITFSTKFELQR